MDGRDWLRFAKIGSGLPRLVQSGSVWLGFGQIGSDWPSLVQIAQIGPDWRSFAQICLDWHRLALIGSDHSLRSDLLGLAQIDSLRLFRYIFLRFLHDKIPYMNLF